MLGSIQCNSTSSSTSGEAVTRSPFYWTILSALDQVFNQEEDYSPTFYFVLGEPCQLVLRYRQSRYCQDILVNMEAIVNYQTGETVIPSLWSVCSPLMTYRYQ